MTGRVIAEGTSDELKSRVGGGRIEVSPADPAGLHEAAAILGGLGSGPAVVDETQAALHLPVADPSGVLAEVVRRLDRADIEVLDLALQRPTLDDVFLSLTGGGARNGAAPGAEHDRSAA